MHRARMAMSCGGLRAGVTLLVVALSCGSAVAAEARADGRTLPGAPARVAASSPQTPAQAMVTPPAGTAEQVVRDLYRRVTFDAGRNVDWEQVKALFIPEAVVVLRTSRTSMSVFNRDAFVADFVRFITQAKLEDRAFEETIVAMKTEETGDVARATVHYTARIPSADRPAQHGIDVFLLMKTPAGWRIVSIVNEIVREGVAVPDELRE